MAVFRVERNTGYTVMSNHHLRNKELSLKAKGLLSQMLSLPEDWDYTLAGLSYINRESIDAIRTAVWELEKAGYITRRQGRDEKGKMTAIEYTIYEQPQPPELDCPVLEKPTADNPILENPTTDNPTSENPTQLNKDISRTNLPKKEKSNTDLSITHSIPIHSLNPLPYDGDEAAEPPERKRTERNDAYRVYEEIIKDNIAYDILLQDRSLDRDRLNEIVDLMLETVCTARKKIRIAGDDYPAELVKSKFMKLNSEHIRFVLDCMQENTHEAIIDQQTFDLVQKIRGNVRRYPDGWGEAAPLTGLLYCADCGGKMYVHRTNNGKRISQYTCSQYSKVPVGKLCKTQHRINEDVVLSLVSEMLKAIAEYAKHDRAEFVRVVQEAQSSQQTAEVKKQRTRLATAKQRVSELEVLLCKIYEDNILGKLSDSRYATLDAQYEKEQSELTAEISVLEKAVKSYEKHEKDADRFIALIDKYENFDKLTIAMLNEFIEKILVHERDRKGSIQTTQEVEIYFNFVGRFVPPAFGEVELTPEELEEIRKREERKDRLHQNYLKRKANGKQKEYEERTKAKKKAEIEARKQAIRTEDIARGVFIPVSSLPQLGPRKGA